MKWLDVAWQEVGQQEVSGSGANPEIISYFRAVNRPDVTSDEVSWCAAFVGRCLELGGIPIAGIPKDDRLLANSYLKIGTPIDVPRIGAICVLSRGSDPRLGHVGFVVGVTPTQVALLGGNQADKVCTANFPRSRIRGLRWPETVTMAEVDATSRIAKAAKQVQADSVKTGGGQVVGQVGSAVHDATTSAVQTATDAASALPSAEALAGKAMGLQSAIEVFIQFVMFTAGKLPWVMAACGAYWIARIAWNSSLIRQWRHADAAEGKTVSTPADVDDTASLDPISEAA